MGPGIIIGQFGDNEVCIRGLQLKMHSYKISNLKKFSMVMHLSCYLGIIGDLYVFILPISGDFVMVNIYTGVFYVKNFAPGVHLLITSCTNPWWGRDLKLIYI